jgi:hypothetical protein
VTGVERVICGVGVIDPGGLQVFHRVAIWLVVLPEFDSCSSGTNNDSTDT